MAAERQLTELTAPRKGEIVVFPGLKQSFIISPPPPDAPVDFVNTWVHDKYFSESAPTIAVPSVALPNRGVEIAAQVRREEGMPEFGSAT